MLGKKHPERVHLAQQAAGKLPCVIVPVMILVNQTAQPGIPRAPLPTRGRRCGHMTQALQLGQRPGTTGRQVWRLTGCQATGGT